MVKNALYLFDKMGKCSLLPSLRSCNLLSGLVRKGGSYAAILMFNQMVMMGIMFNMFNCTIIVNANCKNGRVDKALESPIVKRSAK